MQLPRYFKPLRQGVFSLIFLLLVSLTSNAQYFGRNKVNYKKLDFRVLQTPNFDLYNYLDNRAYRNRFAQQTEHWYRMHQQVFKDTFQDRNPFLLYNNHADFQQTRAIEGEIGVGTGGVTEGLKNRVIMPVMESNAQTDHVLGHELVHAFQYHIIQDTFSLQAIGNIPLWMVEGLAEYMSIGPADAHTAIWLRNGVASDKLPTLKDLTNKPNEFFPYRWGQAFWTYATALRGDTVIRKLFIETARVGYEAAIKNVFKIDAKEFSEQWKSAIKNAYDPFRGKTSMTAPGIELIGKKNAGELNIVPSISPDGTKVAYWTEKNLFSVDLYISDASTGRILEKVSSSTFGSHIDEYSSFESSVAWSPDSRQLAFVAFAKGRNRLILANAENGKITRELDIPGVPAISNPTWSPDGNTIVVTGLVQGQSDLYSYNLQSAQVRQLTNDRYSDLQPSFSADGKSIVFTTDRKSIGDNRIQHSFWHNLALLDVASGNVTNLNVFDGANNLNPVFGSDNNRVYFLSDRDGFRNLYSYDIASKEVSQLTNLFTGITGITMYSPAISVSRSTNQVVYSYYFGETYSICSARQSDLKRTSVGAGDVVQNAALLPPFTRVEGNIVNANLKSATGQGVPETAFTEVPFKPRFELDYIGNTGVGVGVGPMGGGVAGGVQGIFSDILGNNQLFGAVSLNGELVDIGGQFAYLNQKSRLNWGAAYSHIPYVTGGQGLSIDTTFHPGDSLVNSSLDLLRTFQDQVAVFASYPFSQIRRVESGISFARYYYRLDRYSDFYAYSDLNNPNTYRYVGSEREKLDVPEGFNLGQAYIALVGDNSNFGVASPLNGHRFRLEAGKYAGAVDLMNYTADYRRYFRFAPVTLATRAMYLGRFGEDAENGTLPPLYIGYPTLVRGYNARDFAQETNNPDPDVLTINDLIGNQMSIGNIELRLPFTGPERLSAIKSKFLFSELNLFTDAGIAWGNYDGIQIGTKPVNRVASDSKVILSSGISLRVNVFGYLVVEPFYAIPWQNGGFKNGSFGFNFQPGW